MGHFLDLFSSKMNFSYEIFRPDDGLWSARLPNGSFKGMVGMLERQNVEFALGPFFATEERNQVCDFTVPVAGDSFSIFMIRPTLSNDISGFLKPFTPLVWTLILLSILGIVTGMSFLVWGESRCFDKGEESIIAKATLWALQTMSQESSEWMPKHDGGRVVVTTWLFASLVFMSSYGGILTAMLTVPRVVIPIDSAKDLVRQSALPWRLEAGTMMVTYLKESEDPIKRQVHTKMEGTMVSCWRSRQDFVDGKYAGICDYTAMKTIMSWDFSTSGSCHLYISKEIVYSGGILSVAFKTNSTYMHAADRLLLSLKESGIFDKWLNDQFTNTTECLRPPSADKGNKMSALGLESLAGIFILLVVGGYHRLFELPLQCVTNPPICLWRS
ncbi:glutamate receptor ionotropic, kainate 3-like [Macrobrachium nipponense]|uniref:glutamate receptor ionotropic, kainate 3-like n=1 Tax=Macrobrachium nipponense TaxID=159736 RepID=UPI0030C84E15